MFSLLIGKKMKSGFYRCDISHFHTIFIIMNLIECKIIVHYRRKKLTVTHRTHTHTHANFRTHRQCNPVLISMESTLARTQDLLAFQINHKLKPQKLL